MKFYNVTKQPWKNIHYMLAAFWGLIENVICLATLGFRRPNLEMKYLVWNSKNMLTEHKKFPGKNRPPRKSTHEN